MKKYLDDSNTPLYKKIKTEVEAVAFNYMGLSRDVIDEHDFSTIAQRIVEERKEDSLDFHVPLSEIEELTDDDDWSEVNGCIENMIKKFLNEQEDKKSVM